MLLPFAFVDRRPLRPLPAAADPAGARAAQLPQPALLLALDRRAVRAVRACSASGPAARRGRSSPSDARRRRLARARARLRSGLLAALGWAVARQRLVPRRPLTAEEELAGHTAGAARARRASRCSSSRRTRSRSSSSCSSAARLALAAAGAHRRSPWTRAAVLAAGFAGPAAPARLVRRPLRARARRALVRAGADRRRATSRCSPVVIAAGLAGRGAPAHRARARPLRAVPGARRAAAARADPQTRAGRSCSRRAQAARVQTSATRATVREHEAHSLRILGTLLIVGGVGMLAWTVVVWQLAGPVHRRSTRGTSSTSSRSATTRMRRRYRAPHYPTPAAPSAAGPHGPSLVAARRDVALAARRLPARLARGRGDRPHRRRSGSASNMVLVNGTDDGTLKKGPGRYLGTYMPGEGAARLHRRPPHDVPRAVLAHRQAARPATSSRSSMPYGRSRTGSPTTSSCRRTTWPCCKSHGQRDRRAPGVPPALLRDAPLHRVRAARALRAAAAVAASPSPR